MARNRYSIIFCNIPVIYYVYITEFSRKNEKYRFDKRFKSVQNLNVRINMYDHFRNLQNLRKEHSSFIMKHAHAVTQLKYENETAV